jgi:Ca2+-binding RTX toxin-like protein
VALLFLLAAPSAASARADMRVIDTTPRGGEGKVLVVTADSASDTLTLAQANEGGSAFITLESSDGIEPPVQGCQATLGQTPARLRCRTDGVLRISVILSGLFTPSATPDANSLDLSAVNQLVPDASGPLPVSVSGGPGADTIVGSAGRLSGFAGAGNDFVRAGAGDDELDGGLGNDIVLGGEGNDSFGDFHTPDSDILSGGPGRDQVVARGTVTLNDRLCNDGSGEDAPAPPLGAGRFVDAPEGRLECSGTGADRDLIAGIEIVGQAFDNSPVDFTGSAADEILGGQQGADRFEGGGGSDSIVSSEGDDLLLARDNAADARLDCGGGDDDRAVVDQADPVEPNCETIERGRAEVPGPVGGGAPLPPLEGFPPTPPPSPPLGNQPSSGDEGNGAGGGDGRTPPELEIPTRVAFIKRGRIQIRVRCVYRARACRGTLTLRAAQSRRVGRRRVRRGARLASGRVNVPWGTSRATTMRAPRSLVRLMRGLRGQRTLRVRALVVAKDSGAGRRARSARRSRVVVLGLQR